jgi:outer membrane protein
MAGSIHQENSELNNKMRYYKLLFLGLVVFGNLKAYSQAPADSVLTLQQCIDLAIKNNLSVKTSELQMQTQEIAYNQARENLLPSINGSVSHNISNGRSQDPTNYNYVTQQITYAQYNLNSNLTLFNGMSLINNIKRYSLAYQAGKMDFQQAKDLVTLNVITAYLQVLDNEDLLKATDIQVEQAQRQVDRLVVLNKDGATPPATLYDLKGTLATSKIGAVNTKAAMGISKINLLQIMNVPLSKDIKLARLSADQLPGSYDKNADEIYTKALNDLALVKAYDLRLKSAEKEVKSAKGALWPTITAFGSLASNYSSTGNTGYYSQIKNNYSSGFGVGLSVPILNYFQNRNKVALARIDLQTAKYNNYFTRIQLKQNIDQAYINMTSALERYHLLRDQVDAYGESYRIAEVKFNSGAITSVDFVIAKSNFDQANTNLINARYDYFIRTKILDYYQGNLAL